MPPWSKNLLTILGLAGMIPLLLIFNARVSTSADPRIHLIHDMDHQDKFRAQEGSPLFADGRAMRLPVPGTVARGELREDDHFERGLADGKWATALPAQVRGDTGLLARGRERYEIFCAPCHGLSGYGDGMVHQRADQLKRLRRPGMSWANPTSYHDQTLRDRPDGYLFHVIGNGIRNMAPYGGQIPVRDRWAIVAYLRALQRSQNPREGDQ
jgi:mono/diheme cytochrome c family protein